MQPKDLLIHCYFERDGDEWLAFCLDFTLVAQARTMEEANQKLLSQIREYVHDATVGEDRQHAGYLLRRRAPVKYWLKFYFTLWQQHRRAIRRRKSSVEPVPMVPAYC